MMSGRVSRCSPDAQKGFFPVQKSLLYRQVSAGGGQQERTEIMKIRTDRRRREQGSHDASEQDPDQSGSPREEAREDRGKKNQATQATEPAPGASIEEPR